MRAIHQTLPGLIDELPGLEARQAIVFAIWPTVIGEPLREISAPIELEGKILAIAVTGSEWKREFEQHAGQIVFRLNASVKSSIVERLVFVIDPDAVQASNAKPDMRRNERLSTNAISQDVSVAAANISDPELRNNFLNAAAACIERRDSAKE